MIKNIFQLQYKEVDLHRSRYEAPPNCYNCTDLKKYSLKTMYKLTVINIVMICAFYNFWEVILMNSPMHFVWQTITKKCLD